MILILLLFCLPFILASPVQNVTELKEVQYNYLDNITLICPSNSVNSWVSWKKDGKILEYKRKISQTGRNLTISGALFRDGGLYSCLSEGRSTSYSVSVVGKPVFTSHDPLVLMKPTGNDVSIPCYAISNPPPTSVVWFKNEIQLKNKTNPRKRSDFRLGLHSITLTDQANYSCLISNSLGQISKTYKLDVVVRSFQYPTFQKLLTDHQVPFDGNITLACPVSSDLNYQLNWFFKPSSNFSNNTSREFKQKNIENKGINIEDIDDLAKVISALGNDLGASGENGEVFLQGVDESMEGMYSCVAYNDNGLNWQSMWLSIEKSETSPIKGRTNFYTELGIIITACLLCVLLLTLLILLVVIRLCRYKQAKVKGRLKGRVVVMKENALYDITSQSSLLGTPRLKLEKTFFSEDNVNDQKYEVPMDSKWEIDRNNLKMGSLLGEGEFGKVVKATLTSSQRHVAVKMLKEDASDQDLLDLVHEMEVMKRIDQHPNVLALVGCCTQKGPLYVVVEFALYGNLKEYLKLSRTTSLDKRQQIPFKELVWYAVQIANGLEYLSSKLCVHRDVAARNVMVAENHIMKIGDFGLTRSVGKNDYYKKTTNGRLPVKWMAPEALFDRKCDVQSDVWSYGVLLWELFSMGGNPYPSIPVEHLFNLLKAGYRMEAPAYCSEEIYDIMLKCWDAKPYLRPSFTQLKLSLSLLLHNYCHHTEDLTRKECDKVGDISNDVPLKIEEQRGSKDDVLKNYLNVFCKNIKNNNYINNVNDKNNSSNINNDSNNKNNSNNNNKNNSNNNNKNNNVDNNDVNNNKQLKNTDNSSEENNFFPQC